MRLVAVLLLAQHFEVMTDCGGGAPPVNDPPATGLRGGAEFGCAVKDGAVRCWGDNQAGQLGRGTLSAFEASAPVPLSERVAQLAGGDRGACARTVTGKVWCWGSNDQQQLGRVDPPLSATPVEVEVPVPVAKLSMHSDYVLALGSDGRLFAWGNSSEGNFGRGDPNPRQYPLPAPRQRAGLGHLFKDITAGQGHACGIDLDDVLWCWGRSGRGELGVPSVEQERAPVKVLDGVRSVVAGAFGTCAIQLGGELWCWGDTPIEDATMARIIQPLPVRHDLGGKRARSVDQTWFSICAVTDDDTLFCWGRGIEGQLGQGGISPASAPRETARGIRSVAAGWFFTCAERLDGAVACTGENNRGQLGLSDQNRRYTLTDQ